MMARGEGITKTYNRIHNPDETARDIVELRGLQSEIDRTVARVYGWDDLDLNHGFHKLSYLPESDRVRFTISEAARFEVLRRLSELNRQRYEGELAQGLHSDGNTRTSSPGKRKRRSNVTPAQLMTDLFDGEDS